MHRSSINITTLIILFSILTVLGQFSAYYFLDSAVLIYGIAVLLSLLFSHIFLEQTLNYDSCFSYSLLNVFLCTIIILLSFFGKSDSFLLYNLNLILFIVINWFVPVLYCIIRNLSDSSQKYTNFTEFYRNINIVFIFFYIGIFITILFLQNQAYVLYYTDFYSINVIPFLTLATLIEDYLSGSVALGAVFMYLVQSISLFIPYGFYAILLLRYQSRLLRILILLILPLLVEVLQRVFLLGKGDIDDIILGVIGGFIGAICYHILNSIYQSFTDEDFLYKRPHYSFSSNSLHF